MKKILVTYVLLLLINNLQSQDSLSINFNKKQFKQGDTLSIACIRKSDKIAPATLNVWIRKIGTKSIWKFRYPLLNNETTFDLKISESLQDGEFAVNFIIQHQFFNLLGNIQNYNKEMGEVTMLMLAKNKENHYSAIETDDEGNFSTGKLVFEDTAKFIFYPVDKRETSFFVDIKNYIDSAFVPESVYTEIINIGKAPIPGARVNTYHFSITDFDTTYHTLQDVTIFAKGKSVIEKFNKTFTTGLFKGDGKLYDGIDDPEISRTKNVGSFLHKKATGLQIVPSDEGIFLVTRDNQYVDMYVDEIHVQYTLPDINPADIAMIKIFDPFTGPGYQGGGSIAIYTKSGHYMPDLLSNKNIFFVKGFTPPFTVWK